MSANEVLKDCVVEVSLFRPDVESETHPSPHSPCSMKGSLSYLDAPHQEDASWTSPQPNHAPYMELSPTGRSTIPPGEHAGLIDWMTRAGEKILPSPRRELTRYPDLRPSNQNAVDIERIRLGLDVRTTVSTISCINYQFNPHKLYSTLNDRSCCGTSPTRSTRYDS